MTNIITLAFLLAISHVEQGPTSNPYRMTAAAWSEAMQWRQQRGEPSWPFHHRSRADYAQAACRSFNERNWSWLTEHYQMPADPQYCRATLYTVWWKGRSRYHRWRSVPPSVWSRGVNVAQLTEVYEHKLGGNHVPQRSP